MWRFVDLFLVAINCLERLVSEMAYCVQWDVKPYALTHSVSCEFIHVIFYCCERFMGLTFRVKLREISCERIGPTITILIMSTIFTAK